MEELTISVVARQAGVRASTIRYYESIHVLPPPRRVSGRRRYDPAILDRLAFIHVTQQLGFTLTEIQHLFHHQDRETPLPELWQTLARQKLADVERLIQHALDVKLLLVQGLDCGCPNLNECIDCVLAECDEPQRT
jgi:MerR family transcriptional regulator, redox-sensitive transcriptional activator SoxR